MSPATTKQFARLMPRRFRRRQGVIFVTTLCVMLLLTAMVFVLVRNMRVESLASGNRASGAQAAAIEQGAEQYVLSMIDQCNGVAVTVTSAPAEAMPVGTGYFWILRPWPDTDQTWGFGIADEASKISLNATWLDDSNMQYLPNVTQQIADAIIDWGPNSSKSLDGDASDIYDTLPDPYSEKQDAFETVEELLLVQNVTKAILFGSDLNRDGVVDAGELQSSGANSQAIGLNSGENSDTRGLFNYVTVYSNSVQTSTSRRRDSRGNRISTTSTKNVAGLVNVFTASEPVLECANMLQADADSWVAERSSANGDSSSWQSSGLTKKYPTSGPSAKFTTTSYQYSADIVAVSGDGRAFKRVRIVVDDTQGTSGSGTPPHIIYRRDLTGYGWPLDPQIRQQLRAGTYQPSQVTTGVPQGVLSTDASMTSNSSSTPTP
jgi:hypothetical protein